jgi:hypothetical protein
MISKSWIFRFVFFEGNLLRECQMNIMSVYWEKRSLLIHSFSTPPKTYPTRKQYRRKKKKPPKHIRTPTHENWKLSRVFRCKTQDVGITISFGRQQQAERFTDYLLKVSANSRSYPKLHKAFVA